jgi:SNF2 family DNA or RNA helicase
MQFEFIDPDIIGIGDYYAFRNRYAVMGGYIPKEGKMAGKAVQVVGYQNLEELIETISPYVFQVTKEQAKLDLPPQRYQKRVIPMIKEQRTIYDSIRKEGVWSVGGDEQVAQNALEIMLRCQQVCGGFTVKGRTVEKTVRGEKRIKKVYDPVPVMDDADNPKLKELIEILHECKDNQITIWANYLPEIRAIHGTMLGAGMQPPALYFGEVDDKQRDEYDKGFKSGKYKVMLANQATGDMGLTWVSTNAVVVYYSNANKFISREQSEGRAHRIGATGESVLYIDLLMERSVDLTIAAALKERKDLFNYLRERITQATLADLLVGAING